MQILERIWEVLGTIFSSVLGSFERTITSVFGSSNARFIKTLQGRVDAIGDLEPKYEAMSDDELCEQTSLFRDRLAEGETLDQLLEEAFAVCREAGKRYLNMRHYDVQLIGGMVLHSGAIAEMVTGEGKTLVATLPVYLNALDGKGVHVVTVNDYLARRDMEWMGPLYMGLGLTVDAIQSNMPVSDKQAAYACDITYGTNNEFGFDYLRDNMRPAAIGDERYPSEYQQSQGRLAYAVIDEVDNILIDEARTPLIISGPAHDDITKYSKADKLARQLRRDEHFEVNEKDHTTNLTDPGIHEAERLAGVESFYTAGNMEWPHLIDNALKAHHLYKLDVNYVVREGKVIIVDEFTGRLMDGRQWSDGLHQAVEAKEGVKIKEISQTLATITLQNFFKLYEKICGMTGTAMTEAGEFWKIYELEVVAIPTNRTMERKEFPDVIYCTEREKYAAVAEEIERYHKWDILTEKGGEERFGTIVREEGNEITFQPQNSKKKETLLVDDFVEVSRRGRPVLVGTVSIEKSERISNDLNRRGIKHEVLNAKHHQREADIVAQAGRAAAVTIATNMAGRGTDIVLGGNPDTMAWAQLQHTYETRLDVPSEEWDTLVAEIDEREGMSVAGDSVRDIGGLYVIGTERHDSRRIDLQLRGRCGRQGDPGGSRFFLSLEDDLMRKFAGEWVKNMLQRLGMSEGEAIESRLVTRRIEAAQKKVEERHFEARKNLLEYDEVMDEQRKRVYSYRQRILDGTNCRDLILEMIEGQVEHQLEEFLARDFGVETFTEWAGSRLSNTLETRSFRGLDFEAAEGFAKSEAERMAEGQVFDEIEENLPQDDDERQWNWNALAKNCNARWGLNVRDRDLKSVGRDGVAELLISKARDAVQRVKLDDGARYLDSDFGLHTVCGWVHHKFDFKIDIEEIRSLEKAQLKKLIIERAIEVYGQKETEFPVMAGLLHCSEKIGGGARRIDRERLVAWARVRFDVDLDLENLKNKQREEIRALLIDHSKTHCQQASQAADAVAEKIDSVYGSEPAERAVGAITGGNGTLESLSDWALQTLKTEFSSEVLAPLDRDALSLKLYQAVEDLYRPEMRRMERQVLLELVDTAWKDHLLAMDHLRSAVGLVGYAQVDPKTEYKREGMRMFESMWTSIGERATDLVFRMEQSDEEAVSNTFVETAAVHEEAVDSDIAEQQRAAIDGSQAEDRVETIRNREKKVGRNEPCTCGSGKKYKNCHGKR